MIENDLKLKELLLTIKINNLNEAVNNCAKSFESMEKSINQVIDSANQLVNVYCEKWSELNKNR